MTTCILFSEWNVVTFDTTPALPRPVLCRRWKLPCAEAGWGGAVPHQDHKCLQILLRQRPQHCQWIPWKRQGPEAWGEGKVRNFKCRFIHAGRVNSISNAFSFCVSPTGIFTPTLPRLWAPTLESWMIRFTTSFTPSSKWKKTKLISIYLSYFFFLTEWELCSSTRKAKMLLGVLNSPHLSLQIRQYLQKHWALCSCSDFLGHHTGKWW